MRKALLLAGLAAGLFSCGGAPQTSGPDAATSDDSTVVDVPAAPIPEEATAGNLEGAEVSPEGFPFAVTTYTFNELNEVSAGGCGMSLWRAGESPRAEGILLFHGIDEPAVMRFDGEFQSLERTAATGEEFYGQQSEQTFATADGETTVRVSVALGEPGEIESVAIAQGTLAIETEGLINEIPVEGDAGC